MNVSIIPARGGSKGVPKKNIQRFLGEPLITHTISQSLQSDRIDRTFVSTDDKQIESVAQEAEAGIIERPEEIAGDKSSTEEALLHAVHEIESDGLGIDTVVLLQCTSPLRRESDIDNAVKMVTEGQYDSVLSCCKDHSFYWKQESDHAQPINYDPQKRQMRQDLEQQYRENGSIYAVARDTLLKEKCRVGGNIGLHLMPKKMSFEIDSWDDFDLIESIAKSLEGHFVVDQ